MHLHRAHQRCLHIICRKRKHQCCLEAGGASVALHRCPLGLVTLIYSGTSCEPGHTLHVAGQLIEYLDSLRLKRKEMAWECRKKYLRVDLSSLILVKKEKKPQLNMVAHVPRKLREEDHKTHTNLGYIVKPYVKSLIRIWVWEVAR